jgi:hypothetical protein
MLPSRLREGSGVGLALRLHRHARHQRCHLGADRLPLFAGRIITIPAAAHRPVIIALETSEPFFAPADFAATLFIGFGLAGGGQINAAAGDFDRQCHCANRRLGKAALQGERGENKSEKMGCAHGVVLTRTP